MHYWLARLLFQRGLALLYLVAFASALNQFPVLLGERGLLPAAEFVRRLRFRDAPSLFHWRYSDRLLRGVGWSGIALSAVTAVGLTEGAPLAVGIAVWLVMWALYLSIVNVGQTFYGFGWESMLLEAGFFAAFLGPRNLAPPLLIILILRWMLFRVEFGAGLIKLRGDECWRNLTCLDYHYETQPLPNAIGWYFHRLPKPVHRVSVAYSHFVQLVAPWGLFAPQPVAAIAAAVLISQQLILIVSGNYSWLNWLTVVLAITGFSDATLFMPGAAPPPATSLPFDVIVWIVAALAVVLSIKPALNLVSRNQLMNYSWNPIHLVNAYGAFGSVTKERYEIVIEGTSDDAPSAETVWREYEFKGKPVDPKRRPPQVAPYHLRLDWLLWFLPFSVMVGPSRISVPGYELWFVRFLRKLLEGDREMLALVERNPFPDAPPVFVRAKFYRYSYTTWREKRETGAWWRRTFIDYYIPPLSLADLLATLD